MKTTGKIVKIISIVIAGILVSLVLASLLFEDAVSSIFIKEVNKKLLKPAIVGETNFSLIRHFPDATVQLDEITLFSFDNDTLISAEKIIISLKLTDLIRKDLTIGKISIVNATLNIRKDKEGKSNTRFWKESEKGDSTSISMDLNSIRVENTGVSYFDAGTNLNIYGIVSEASSRIQVLNDTVRIEADAKLTPDTIAPKGRNILQKRVPLETSLSIEISESVVHFNESRLTINRQQLGFRADFYIPGKGALINVSTESTDIAMVKEYLPAGINSTIDRFSINGISKFDVNISNNLEGKSFLNSVIEVKEGGLSLPDRNLHIRDAIISSEISTALNDPASRLSIKANINSGQLNSREFSGSFSLLDMSDPLVDLIFNGSINPSELINQGEIESLISAEGVIRASIRLSGKPGPFKNIGVKELSGLKRAVNLNFSDLSVKHSSLPFPVEHITGNMMISDNIWLDEIGFLSDGQRGLINGRLNGFSEWLTDHSSAMDFTAAVWLDKFDSKIIREFNNNNSNKTTEGQKKSKNNISLNLNLDCDSLVAGDFRASLFSADIGYRKGFVNIGSFSLNALSGYAEGNASIVRSAKGGFMTRGWFDLVNININEAFRVFNNFGQQNITAQNLRGNLTGNISLGMLTNKELKPDLKTLEVTGKYIISQGELINFEPVLKLSRFIELEELAHIEFSELHNDLIIKDETLIIPSMDIESSAFNISLSGEQSFRGSYLYHLKLYLSDLLSTKAIRANEDVTEFGIIEDDELGRTALFLKIEGSDGDSKVSYDMSALRQGIREDIKEEKGVLRSILNEEYGLYKNDSIQPVKTEETRKFRIVWEEVDSISIDTPPEKEKGLPIFNRLRKKKKNQ